MERGLIFDIRRYSVHDGPGIRTTVFLKGCPLNCAWCHNPESILPLPQKISRCRKLNGHARVVEEEIGRWLDSATVFADIIKDRIFFEESQGGVTFSGGEPLTQLAFLIEMLNMCKGSGIHTAVDTSGYAPTALFLEASAHADVLLFDIKSANPTRHNAFTGVDNALIISNMLALPINGPEVFVRIPVIPGFNDSLDDMRQILDIVCKVKAPIARVDLLPFHRLGRQKYEALGMAAPPAFGPEPERDSMEQFMQVFSEAGFGVKLGG
jgi:pyruvate formate lyase activating enzyme